MNRIPPSVCPVCGDKVFCYESGRVLCSRLNCDFEWVRYPDLQMVAQKPERPMTNLDVVCWLFDWRDYTVNQVARKLGVTPEMVLGAKDIFGLVSAVAV